MRDMSRAEWRMAKIDSTYLGYEDHGIFTSYVNFKAESWGQGFGGMYLGSDVTDRWIKGVLKAVGVRSWEEVKGHTMLVFSDSGMIYAIAPVPTSTNWRERVFAASEDDQEAIEALVSTTQLRVRV